MILALFLLILPALAYPRRGAPFINRRDGPVDPLTSFVGYAGCESNKVSVLKQTMKDVIRLADASLDSIHDELISDVYPSRKNQQVDFSKQAAIEFFGPESENAPEQARIFDTMYNAAQAYPGWGFDDWWNNRGIFVSCLDEHEVKPCENYGAYAYYDPDHKYDYPLLVFCDKFFTELRSLDDVIKTIDDNADLQQNCLNMNSRATAFLHELTHIAWGTAKVCRGVKDDDACVDHFYILGNKPERVYGPGYAKLVAKVPFDKDKIFIPATNSDNYAYYAASKFMQKRWKQYPKYRSAWDPNLDFVHNWHAQKSEPGFPPELKNAAVPNPVDYDVFQEGPPADLKSGVYIPVESYPEWYQPVIKAAPGNPVPDVAEPAGVPTYNGPGNDDIVCETSDGSPEITDCYHAFGSLKTSGALGALHGEKDGTWWAGYVESCALAIYYTENWGDDCKMTNKDIDDYATAILEKCSKGDKNVVGGHAFIKLPNCPGQVQISHTGDGPPPQGV